ncbi:hypothetical protein [Ligilactobacillus ceti]|uniref:Lipoprotein n=1 Tax=Ligilactobacillus ceti DSM 22408 TaxID=1122146 RepID=A0A0R2KR95_9LACO|nr:hypothetical protein [Ligilactobacillus ceti]KRN89420.1 lipoprotein [Ligilactobacillus ceti DSM 22408]
MFKNNKWMLAVMIGLTTVTLGACGNKNAQTNQGNDPSSAVYEKDHYEVAIDKISAGKLKAAQKELNEIEITDQTPTKVTTLKNNLAELIALKAAINNNDLPVIEPKLQQLAQVQTPKAFVKQYQLAKKDYQTVQLANTYYTEVVKYYQAGKYLAAGGSLQSLDSLNSKLAMVTKLQNDADQYSNRIAQKEYEAARLQNKGAGDINAQNSQILKEQFAKQTGKNIAHASEEEVAQAVKALQNKRVLQAFTKATNVPIEKGDQCFVQSLGNHQYQIEIRHTSDTNQQISNLKGMYRFNTDTKVAQKLNILTGEYQKIS